MFVAQTARFVLDKLYWLSPYRWFDEWARRSEEIPGRSAQDREKIRRRRYLFSELYIVGWGVIAILLLLFGQCIPALAAYVALLRVVGILNKELGVALFGICKITEGRKVSSSGRVVVLALINYFVAALLFAFAYTKIGTYSITSNSVAALSLQRAVMQSFSIQFSLQPAYQPAEPALWTLVYGQVVFCFLFGTIILSLFVSLLQLTSTLEDRASDKSGS
jgi:hypothetical protein